MLDGYEILLKMLNFIVSHPQEDKYRQIKGTNPKIKATLFSLAGVPRLLATMGFTEIETDVFVYLESDIHMVQRYAHIVDDTLMPIRMQFMSAEEKAKTLMIMQRKVEMADKKQKEREHTEQLKRQAEYDRQEKAGQKIETLVGNKLTFGANIQVFKPPVSKGG